MRVMEQGHMQPIYYASKTLTRTKRNYITTKWEALGIVYAVTKFRYLLCSPFILHVDHQALIYIVNKATLIGKMARWLLLLQEFNININHTSQNENAVVDFLSRIENHNLEQEQEMADDLLDAIALFSWGKILVQQHEKFH